MIKEPNDVFVFLMPINLHLDYENLANSQFNVVVQNLTTKEIFIVKTSPEIFFTHFAFKKTYQNGKLAKYQNAKIKERTYQIDTSSLLQNGDIQLKNLLDEKNILDLLGWKRKYLNNAKNIHCTLIKKDNLNIIIPHYAIATYYYFIGTIFREAALKCKLDDLYLSCSCGKEDASIIVPNSIKNQDEAILIHRFICQKDAKKGFEDIGRYILNYLKFMKEKEPKKHIKYMPIKAAFPMQTTFTIDARVSSFHN